MMRWQRKGKVWGRSRGVFDMVDEKNDVGFWKENSAEKRKQAAENKNKLAVAGFRKLTPNYSFIIGTHGFVCIIKKSRIRQRPFLHLYHVRRPGKLLRPDWKRQIQIPQNAWKRVFGEGGIISECIKNYSEK